MNSLLLLNGVRMFGSQGTLEDGRVAQARGVCDCEELRGGAEASETRGIE